MHTLSNLIKYALKKRKQCVFAVVCCILLLYEGVVLLFFHHDYSPLQLLPGVDNEARRLLKFLSQTHIHCNSSTATNNASTWMLCQEMELKSDNEDKHAIIVYSVGPSPDYNFEYFMNRNLSSRLYIFSHSADNLQFLLKYSSSSTFIFKTSIVPNDPADFARNSFDTQTLNSAMANLKHKRIDILKIDTLIDTVYVYELLHFLIADSLLLQVKELHFVLKLDQVEEDHIYSWYRVLYALFHDAGFRLYHISASDPLCLQDTIMESCKYFLSWIKQPTSKVFVMYPPAVDGSYEYEYERMLTYLADASSRNGHLLSYKFRLYLMGKPRHTPVILSVNLSQNVLQKNTQSCAVIFILGTEYESYQFSNKTTTVCTTHLLLYSPSSASATSSQMFQLFSRVSENGQKSKSAVTWAFIQNLLAASGSNILYIELDQAWDLIGWLSSLEIATFVDQLIVRTSVFSDHEQPQPSLLRKRYSELKRLEEFHLLLVDSDHTDQGIFTLNFVKSVLL